MIRQSMWFLSGVAAVGLAAELLLRVLPVSTATMTGYYHDPDLLTYPRHHTWNTSTGWDLRNPQTLHSNNWGFSAQHDFERNRAAVALVGDSYVEASMLPVDERPAAQLEALLPPSRKVYALGTPGTDLLDHAQRIRWASEHFDIRDFVLLLERFDARQALCGSGNVVSQCLDPASFERRTVRLAPSNALVRVARHSAVAQYFMSQLRFKPQALWAAMFTRATPDQPQQADPQWTPPDAARVQAARTMVDAVVREFYAALPKAGIASLVIVVDGRRDGPASKPEVVDLERAYLIDRLRQQGAIVHDLETRFAEHSATSRRSLAVGPYDHHLNALGVRLAMTAAASSVPP